VGRRPGAVRAIELNVTQVQIIPSRAGVRREQSSSAFQPRELSGAAPPRVSQRRRLSRDRAEAALVAVRPHAQWGGVAARSPPHPAPAPYPAWLRSARTHHRACRHSAGRPAHAPLRCPRRYTSRRRTPRGSG